MPRYCVRSVVLVYLGVASVLTVAGWCGPASPGVAGLTDTASADSSLGPVAAYSFDEGEGGTVEDITGKGHTATIEGAEWTNGKYGGALYFNDEESCAAVADAPDLQLPEEFTVETWVKPQGTGVNEPLISKETEGFFSYSLYLGLQASGKIEGLLGGEEEEIGPDVESDESLPLNVWSHVAMTYDGAHMRLYVNGELQDTAVAEEGAFSSSGPLKFGCSEAYEDDFKGKLDELRIYNRALDAGEISTSTRPTYPDLVHAWEYSANPNLGGSLIAQEWVQLGTLFARREASNLVMTRGAVPCPKEPAAQCGQVRTIEESATPGKKDFVVATGSSLTDEGLDIVGDRNEVTAEELGEPVKSGPLRDALQPWQTPPPKHGSTYSLYLESENIPEGPVITERWWIENATGLLLKSTIAYESEATGETPVVFRRLFTFDQNPQPGNAYGSNIFLLHRPAPLGTETVLETGEAMTEPEFEETP